MRKKIKWLLLVVLVLALFRVSYYAVTSFPIISGFDAKQVCNCIFVANRTAASIDSTEMSEFPFSLARYEINQQDSSVTTSIWGMVKRKAIYRKGIGCTMITGISEPELREQEFIIPRPIKNQDTMPWPQGDCIDDTIVAGIDRNLLKLVVDKAFTEPHPGKKQRTRAVVVVYNGQLVAEQYAPGFSQHTKMYGWSMAKSVTAALIGTLVKQGKVDVKKPAPVPEWKDPNDPRHAITLEHLLQQTSGLDFSEQYSTASDATNMLGRENDMAAFTANHTLAHKPGTKFYYSSGNSNILSRIIRHTVGEKDYAAYPATALFYKIGMYNTLFEPDCSGTYVGSSYINATARDYARFGLLYYYDGVWNGERLLPEGWVKQTVTAPAVNEDKDYGYQFWLNGLNYQNASKRIYRDAPADMFYCDGYAGQRIYIIPSKKLVVVRLGLTLDGSFNENEFLRDVISTLTD